MNSMRRLGIFIFLLLIFGGGIGVLLVGSRKGPVDQTPLSITFTGREPGLTYRAAGFYLTNSGHVSIFVHNVRVQVAENTAWKTLSEGPIQVSPVLDPGRTNINFSPVMEAGDYRKIVVEWPEEEERQWRIEIAYGREAKGIDGIISKCKIAWRTHKPSHMLNRIWVGSHQVFSSDISK